MADKEITLLISSGKNDVAQQRQVICRNTWLKYIDLNKFNYYFFSNSPDESQTEEFAVNEDNLWIKTLELEKTEILYTSVKNKTGFYERGVTPFQDHCFEGFPIKDSETQEIIGVENLIGEKFYTKNFGFWDEPDGSRHYVWKNLTNLRMKAFEFALNNHDSDYFAIIDDDAYVIADYINKFDFSGFDRLSTDGLIGPEENKYPAGFFYVLSRKAVEAILNYKEYDTFFHPNSPYDDLGFNHVLLNTFPDLKEKRLNGIFDIPFSQDMDYLYSVMLNCMCLHPFKTKEAMLEIHKKYLEKLTS